MNSKCLKQIFPCFAHRFEYYYVQHTQLYATIISIQAYMIEVW